MIRGLRLLAAVTALTLCLPLTGFARDTAKAPLPKAAYVDAMSGLPVQSDGSGPDVYVKAYTSKGFDAYISTLTETISGPVQSFAFSNDPRGVHLKVLVKGKLVGTSILRYARVDVTKGTAGFTLGAVIGPSQSIQNSQAKESPIVGGGVSFK